MRLLGEFGYVLLAALGAFIGLSWVFRRRWPAVVKIVGVSTTVALCLGMLLFRGFVGKGVDDVLGAWLAVTICRVHQLQWCTPIIAPPGEQTAQDTTARRIAIGDWVEGSWSASEFDARANITARIASGESFSLFGNVSRPVAAFLRPEIAPEGPGKVLYLNGKRVSETFDDIQWIRPGVNRQVVAANVRRGNQWTVAINGKPWTNWFQDLYLYAVVGRVVTIGVKIDQKWTMAVDGVPWKERFDEIRNYSTYGDGSVIAEVSANGRTFFVKDGKEDARLPHPRLVRINKDGKIAWYDEREEEGTVTVNYNSKWKTKYSRILGLSISDDTGRVAAKVLSRQGITVAVDDVPWSNWYQSSRDPALAQCHSSFVLPVQKSDFATLVVNDRIWNNVFDELGAIGCEASGTVSVAVKKNGLWSIARNEKVLTRWFADLRGWAIDQEGTHLAAAVADKYKDGTVTWRVIVLPL